MPCSMGWFSDFFPLGSFEFHVKFRADCAPLNPSHTSGHGGFMQSCIYPLWLPPAIGFPSTEVAWVTVQAHGELPPLRSREKRMKNDAFPRKTARVNIRWFCAGKHKRFLHLLCHVTKSSDWFMFFPTCQVRVVRFYVSCLPLLLLSSPLLSSPLLSSPLLSSPLLSSSSSSCSLPDLNHDHPRPVCPAGPQPRPSMLSVPCRTSTTSIHAQRSLPDLNHDQPRPVFPAGPQHRPATPSVPCRTSTTTSHAQCSLPDLNHDHPRPVFPAGPQPRPSAPSVPCRTSTTTIRAQCSLPDLM